jgi:uncharacterized protein YcnI
MRHRIALGALAALAALAGARSAYAHAVVSPPVALARTAQVFTLAVPAEREGATTTAIVLTPPAGFTIDSFFPTPGWRRTAVTKGSGESASVVTVKWTGGAVPTGEDSVFSFLGGSQNTGSESFSVRQTYSDGTVVEWSGPKSADTPAPVVTMVSSLGGGAPSTLSLVALVLAAVALVVAVGGLVARGRARPVA